MIVYIDILNDNIHMLKNQCGVLYIPDHDSNRIDEIKLRR